MALQALEEQIREMMQCKICFEDKEIQKQLPCQHTLCLECLNRLKLDDSKYKCPLCQRECFVPNGGFESLPDSLITKQLATIMQATDMARKVAAATPAAATPNVPTDVSPSTDSEKLPSTDSAVSVQSEVARKCHPVLNKGEEIIVTAEEKGKAYEDLAENWEKTAAEIKEKINSMVEEVTVALRARALTKLEAVDEIKKLKQAEIAQKCEKLSEASSNAREVVKKLKALETAERSAEHTDDIDADIKEANHVIQTLRDETFSAASASENNGKFKSGDSVRLRMDLGLLKPSFLDKEINHMSVGYIHDINAKGDCAVIFPGSSAWVGNAETLDKSPVRHDLPMIGDRVRVKLSLEEPHFKWGKSKRGSIGFLRELKNRGPNAGREVSVDFPEDHDWKGIFDELETVPPEPLKVGDEVWISKVVDEPVRGWYGVTSSSVGTLLSVSGDEVVVHFAECEEWRGLLSEIERIRSIMVGDKVRVMKSVKEPKTGWAGVDHDDEGVVKVINDHPEYGKVAGIDFPNRIGLWSCLLSELELVNRHSGSVDRGRRLDINSGDILNAMHQANQKMIGDLGNQQCQTQ